MKIYYGTKNKSKLKHMKALSHKVSFDIEGIENTLADVKESGKHNHENAKLKALGYYTQIKKPIFSCDSGLYFDQVKEEEQPGVLIRRVGNKRLTDDEMIEYYSDLAKKYGGKLKASYRNAICMVISKDEIYEYSGDDIASEPFYIVSRPHNTKIEGFPLDSLSVEISSGKYYYDLKESASIISEIDQGFIDFFNRVFKK